MPKHYPRICKENRDNLFTLLSLAVLGDEWQDFPFSQINAACLLSSNNRNPDLIGYVIASTQILPLIVRIVRDKTGQCVEIRN